MLLSGRAPFFAVWPYGQEPHWRQRLFGKEFGLFGTTGFFLAGSSYDVAVFALFLFQLVFMDTAATIPTGAMAETASTASRALCAASSTAAPASSWPRSSGH